MRERKCDISGARQNSKCMNVSKSNAHTHRVQHVNLQWRKLWWAEGKKFVKMRLATKTLKTVMKNGLHATAKKHGIDLNDYSISFGTGVPGVVPWMYRDPSDPCFLPTARSTPPPAVSLPSPRLSLLGESPFREVL